MSTGISNMNAAKKGMNTEKNGYETSKCVVVDSFDAPFHTVIPVACDGHALPKGTVLVPQGQPGQIPDHYRKVIERLTRELNSCQRVIHYAGGFDPAYVDGALAAIDEATAMLESGS